MLAGMGRRAFVLAHRWLGVALAIFLVPAALTGSVLVWKTGIDEWLNPDLHRAPSRSAARLSEAELTAALRREAPHARISWMDPPAHVGGSARFTVGNWPAPEGRRINEVFVDPATATILGVRSTSLPGLNRHEFIPWLRRFHYSLAMGRTGMLVMGAVALAWLVDCFVGLALTLPRPLGRWRKWRLAWTVRPSRLPFDAHRATGVWLWPVLVVLAMSGVYLNLTHEVFVPAVEWAVELLAPRDAQATVVAAILESQQPMHTGNAFGLTGRLIVFAAGLLTAGLAVTGLRLTVRKLTRRAVRTPR
jgi:uncharacterized iron-regulated membrane protein